MTAPITEPARRRRRAARVSRRLNRLIGPLLLRRRGFGVLGHTGRRSGRGYHTPLRLLGQPDSADRYIALTYGLGTDWYQNLVRSPGSFRMGRVRYEVANPRLVPTADAPISRLLRLSLRTLGVGHLVQIELRPCE